MNPSSTQPALSSLALAAAIGAALSITAAPVAAAEDVNTEHCYGVALKGKNDCMAGAGTTCAGTAKNDYQGDVWSKVPKGSCEKTASPTSPTGHGQLQAFKEKS